MKKPTIEEIKSYMLEIKCPSYFTESEKFFDHHESKGWVVGRAPMKNWQAACRTWKRFVEERLGRFHPKTEMPNRVSGNAPPVIKVMIDEAEECAPPPPGWKEMMNKIGNMK